MRTNGNAINILTSMVFRGIKFFSILFTGMLIGWYAHDSQKDKTVSNINEYSDSTLIEATVENADFKTDRQVEEQNNDVVQGEEAQFELIRSLLKEKKFEAVVSLFESLQQDSNFTQPEKAREIIFLHARGLISKQQYESADALINHYLRVFNRDVTARLLLVEVYNRLKEYPQAIDALYLAKGHAFQQDVLDDINDKIRSIVNKQASLYIENLQYNELLKLYEKLTQQEADYAPYFIGLAQAQLMSGDTDGARNSLQMIVGDLNVGQKASDMLAELQEKQPQSSSADAPEEEDIEPVPGVALIKRGNHYLVDAFPDSGEGVRLLIDTGASLTVFTPEALSKHNVNYKDTGERRYFNTANGIVEAPIYQLDHLLIGEWKVENINIAILELQGNNSAEGLLGMNFLQHFRFFIDQQNALLRLSLRK